MKQKSGSQSAFFNLRVLAGLFLVLTGVFLALLGFGVAQAQEKIYAKSTNPLVLPTLTVPAFPSWASISKKTSGPERS